MPSGICGFTGFKGSHDGELISEIRHYQQIRGKKL